MGWMYVERTTATMGGMIEVIIAVSAVQRSRSRAPPESRGSTSDGVLGLSANHSAAPPRLGGRPLAMPKNLSTPHMTIC